MNTTTANSVFQATLLVVDDEPRVCQYLAATLGRAFPRSRILTAPDGASGLVEIAGSRVDLVISDHRMPGMDGVTFLKRVREESPLTSRFLLTGFANVETVQRAVNEGHVKAFFTKPISSSVITESVRRALETQWALRMRAQAFDRTRTLLTKEGA